MEAGAFRHALDEYAAFMHAQVAQTAACNGNHGLEQRLARWLLMSHDRSDGDDLPTTQEVLATMPSVHRLSATIAARQCYRS